MGFFFNVKVKVFVLNVNDYYFVFESGFYIVIVVEDWFIGSFILIVCVIDGDCG